MPRRGAPIAFGVYRVVRSIGEGGMGEVWLAERSDGEFEQRVAVKRLAYPTPGLLQRFRAGAADPRALEHPNIARLLDGGVDADGTPYLVMEYVEGVPIDRLLRRATALGVAARLRLFLHVCDAVQYAHQNLVVHRDLKPSNILVTADGAPKLLDFGIAKLLDDDRDDAADADRRAPADARLRRPEQFTRRRGDDGDRRLRARRRAVRAVGRGAAAVGVSRREGCGDAAEPIRRRRALRSIATTGDAIAARVARRSRSHRR